MTKTAITIELIWIGILLIISFAIAKIFAVFVIGDSIDIQLHDTYFTFSGDPIYNIPKIWIYLILIKYVIQGLILLAKQNIVIGSVLSLILLIALIMTIFRILISYSYLNAVIPGGDQFDYQFHQINLVGIFFLVIIGVGLLTMLILTIKDVINKIRLLTSSKRHG